LQPAELESTIRAIADDLRELPVTPHVRELRAKAVTYGRVVANWATYAPTAPQVQAMLECVSELREKVIGAKRGREEDREVSRVTRRQMTDGDATRPIAAKKRPSRPLPPGLPPALEWSASVPDAGVHARNSSSRPAPRHDAPTRPPPAFSGAPGATTIPPVSTPRAIDGTPTPVPALLRTRRSR
jgi:hypothetical protein